MPLNNERDSWLQRAANAMEIADGLVAGAPIDDSRPVLPSTVESLQELLRDQLGRSDDSPAKNHLLAQAVQPLVEARDGLLRTNSCPRDWSELVEKLNLLGQAARAVQNDLLNNRALKVQSVDEIVEALAAEARMSMFLCLTANATLSRKVNEWRDRRSGEVRPGDYLDLNSFDFVTERGSTTVSMHDLADNSTGKPVISHPGNFAAKINALMRGEETAPPMYRMAYGQWFTSIFAAWEEVYRPRLAEAHNRADPSVGLEAKDIKSDYFGAIRLIRNDIVHKKGVCDESKKVNIVGWLNEGHPIAPSPAQMIALLRQFPDEELRRMPVK